jgi:hypothetical protein
MAVRCLLTFAYVLVFLCSLRSEDGFNAAWIAQSVQCLDYGMKADNRASIYGMGKELSLLHGILNSSGSHPTFHAIYTGSSYHNHLNQECMGLYLAFLIQFYSLTIS